MKIKVLFQDKNLLVLDKPAGFVVHGDGKAEKVTKEKRAITIADYVLKNFKTLKGVGENLIFENLGVKVEVQKPGIVHRLDKDTTGCLLLAKNQDSYENLKNQFVTHKIRKEYVALVWGSYKYETGIIDTAIARSKSDFRKKEVVKTVGKYRGEEREALTRYKVIKRLEIFGEKLSLVAFFPETGRTHQIRIHSKSLGHPIVGDHLYGPTKTNFEKKYFGKEKVRQLLHAKSITFFSPFDGEKIKVESSIPKDFKKLFELK